MKSVISVVVVVMGAGTCCDAGIVSGLVTADNHYAIYGTSAGSVLYVGGNELGAAGSIGLYNWSSPEPWNFTSDQRIFIAAWSDDAVAQGVLAELNVDGVGRNSGDPAWVVYRTAISRGDGDPHPSAAEVAAHVATADANQLWETPFVGGANGIAPWGTVPGIGGGARWMWYNTPGDPDPLIGGSSGTEMLIFSTTIPAPPSMALLGLFAIRRRR